MLTADFELLAAVSIELRARRDEKQLEKEAQKKKTTFQEATELYLESLEAHGDPIPPPITEEIIEVEI